MTIEPTPAPGEFDPTVIPTTPRPSPWQLLLDHNPCFLLSTALMLLGCYLLNFALDIHTGDNPKLFELLAAINVYEAAIITLGLALLRRHRKNTSLTGLPRDGLWLLLFEILLLTDATFLISETVESSSLGWLVNLTLLILAITKSLIVLRGSQIRLTPRTAGFLILQLLLLYLFLILLNHLAVDGIVSSKILYAAWWIVGLLPFAYDLLNRLDTRYDSYSTPQQILRRTYLIAPWLLLIAHLGFFHYIYHADFTAADLSPILLGLAVSMVRLNPASPALASNLKSFRMLLPGVAVILSLVGPGDLTIQLSAETILRPALLTAAATAITYAWLHSLPAAIFAALSISLMALGWSLRQYIFAFIEWLINATRSTARTTSSLLPTTPAAWGITSITASFLLLALGAWISLKRKPPPLT